MLLALFIVLWVLSGVLTGYLGSKLFYQDINIFDLFLYIAFGFVGLIAIIMTFIVIKSDKCDLIIFKKRK